MEWCWTDGLALSDAAFVQTVKRAVRTPYSLLFRRETPLDVLEVLEPALMPSWFVFRLALWLHARSQMLASMPRNLVLSESPPVDHVLRAPAAEADRVRWLRGLVAALGRPRRGDEQAYVLKLDAWSACSLGIVRRAFPDVPWVFLYREPVQVLASHFRRCGAHMVPGAIDPELFGLPPDRRHREGTTRLSYGVFALMVKAWPRARG